MPGGQTLLGFRDASAASQCLDGGVLEYFQLGSASAEAGPSGLGSHQMESSRHHVVDRKAAERLDDVGAHSGIRITEVVSVRSTELFEVDELIALIEQMTPADAAEYSTFIGAPDNP